MALGLFFLFSFGPGRTWPSLHWPKQYRPKQDWLEQHWRKWDWSEDLPEQKLASPGLAQEAHSRKWSTVEVTSGSKWYMVGVPRKLTQGRAQRYKTSTTRSQRTSTQAPGSSGKNSSPIGMNCVGTQVDFTYTPEPHLIVCLIFVQLQFFSCFEHFFREGVRIEPHVTLCVFLSTPFNLYARTMLHFAPFLSTPFWIIRPEPLLTVHVIFVQTSIFELFWAFFLTRCQNRTPCYISGLFCPAKPKIKPYNQPLRTPH